MIGRSVAMLGGLLVLAACTPPAVVTVNVSHVGTDKGYLNSRLASIGDLFLWDMKSKNISELDHVELTTKKSDDVFTKVDAGYTSGIDFVAGVQLQFKAQIESKVKAQSRLTLANARVTSFQHTFDDLSAFINNKISDGTTTAGQIWNLDEAVVPNSPLRYLLYTVWLRLTRHNCNIRMMWWLAVKYLYPSLYLSVVPLKLEWRSMDCPTLSLTELKSRRW